MTDKEGKENPPVRAGAEGVRIIGAQEASSLLDNDDDNYVPRQPPADPPPFTLPEDEDASVFVDPTPSADMPHWTDPPTGDVPKILDTNESEDTSAWSAFSGPRWRDSANDWDDDNGMGDLTDDKALGVAPHASTADPFSFESDDTQPELVTTRISSQTTPAAGPRPRANSRPFDAQARRRPTSDDTAVRVGTGLVIGVVSIMVFVVGPAATLALATLIVVAAAAELFGALRKAGFRPAVLLALPAVLSLMISAYARGVDALPLVVGMTFVFAMLWHLTGASTARPTGNIAVTMLGVMWTGFLGSFAALLLRMPGREGLAFVIGAVGCTVAYDVGAYAVGRSAGKHPMALSISPHKTWEGMAGGILATLVTALGIGQILHPWDTNSALALGVLVCVVAPLGDLCESMIKRDLKIKDMGSFLPGHGGVLDRVDALLFVLPATYYLVRVLDLGAL